MDIRKTLIIKETIETDGVGERCDPITRVVAVAVIKNPFAGRYAEDLSELFDSGGQLGERLMADAVNMLAGPPVSYGKAAIAPESRFYRIVRIVGPNANYKHPFFAQAQGGQAAGDET